MFLSLCCLLHTIGILDQRPVVFFSVYSFMI